MSSLLRMTLPPKTEHELLARCAHIEGMTFAQLGIYVGCSIPFKADQRKGWLGQVLEIALGTSAGNKSSPDFEELGIELKTLPIGKSGSPTESTYVTSIPLLKIHQQSWHSSQCYSKLKRVLWVPVEGAVEIPYPQRRIGSGFIWSPDEGEEALLSNDWHYLTLKISTGQLETIDASVGECLQIRPKAANGKALCAYFDADGNKVMTLPRGFYLRSRFTHQIFIKPKRNA